MNYELLTLGIFSAAGLFAPIFSELFCVVGDVISDLTKTAVSLVVARREVSEHDFLTAVMGVCERSKFGRNPNGSVYRLTPVFLKSLDEYRNIVVESEAQRWQILWFEGWPIIVSSGEPYRLYYLRGTVDFKKLVKLAEDLNAERLSSASHSKVNRFRVQIHHGSLGSASTVVVQRDAGNKAVAPDTFSMSNRDGRDRGLNADDIPVCWSKEDIGQDVAGSSLDDLSLTEGQLRLVKRVKFWADQREWHRERGIPWRLGCLFYGAPGTGKTSLTRALAEELNMPVHILDISSMSNEQFLNAWQISKHDGTRIVLLEDFDAAFDGRVNPAADLGGVTFDTVLNVIDGIERDDGLLLIVSTNHVEKLDKALGVPSEDDDQKSTRPGRLRLMLKFNPLEYEGRLKLARRILGQNERAERLALENTTDSADQFQDRCINAALAEIWGEIEQI